MTQVSDHRGRSRVAITGLGVKTPAGCDLERFWSNVHGARPRADRLTLIDPDPLPVQIGCEATDFDATAYLEPKAARRLDRVTQLAWGAAADAVEDAGDLDADPARGAVIVGCGVGGMTTLEAQVRNLVESGARRVSPFLVPMMMVNATAAEVAMRLGWNGPCQVLATACASSTNAIGEAARLLRDGTVDVAVAVGAEMCITPTTMAAFARMGALSQRNDDPRAASRPFDADRDGFVIGEGAAALVLERLDRAAGREAPIRAELSGYASTTDAYHVTAPRPDGAGAVACMQQALDDAGLPPEAIGHVNAHGTSTPLNDASEALAIDKVFGAGGPPVTSTKGVLGHLVGAAGATEAVAAVLAMNERSVPPTANHEARGEDIEIDVVAHEPRSIDSAPALSNSFGFGGHNASLIVSPAA